MIVEKEGKKDAEKQEFDSAAEELGYISLEQASVSTIQHALDDRDIYGR